MEIIHVLGRVGGPVRFWESWTLNASHLGRAVERSVREWHSMTSKLVHIGSSLGRVFRRGIYSHPTERRWDAASNSTSVFSSLLVKWKMKRVGAMWSVPIAARRENASPALRKDAVRSMMSSGRGFMLGMCF